MSTRSKFEGAGEHPAASASGRYRRRLRIGISIGAMVGVGFGLRGWVVADLIAEAWVQLGAAALWGAIVLALGHPRFGVQWAARLASAVLLAMSVSVCLVRGAFLPALLVWNAVIPLGLATSDRRVRGEPWAWAAGILGGTMLAWYAASESKVPGVDPTPLVSMLTFFPVMLGIAGLYLRDREVLRRANEALERQRRVGAKMESVGRLAGGVAHDFNNLLAIISTYTELLTEDAKAQGRDDDVSALEAIAGATERGRRLTRQLLAYGGRGVRALVAMYPQDTVRAAMGLLERTLPERLTLRWRVDADGWAVRADPSELENALINLVLNARDAIPEGGEIEVSCSNVVVGRARKPGDPNVEPGRFVCIEVRDTGVGMRPALLEQIFDPFFTTKSKAEGSGLGLTSAYTAVRKLGGDMTVTSQPDPLPDHGSCFRMYLPVSDESADVMQRARTLTPDPANPTTVLLVEDEEAVRVATGLMLRSRGFSLVAAEDGQKAIALFQKHGARIDVVLTDIMMPGLSGLEVARTIRDLDPHVGIVFMSGYAEDPAVERFVQEHGARFIRKPFAADTAERTLRQVARRHAATGAA